MSNKEFIDILRIDEKGHYPFQMFVIRSNGERHLVAMCHNYIQDVYETVNLYIQKGVQLIHFSADFPAILGMNTEFIGVFTYENEKWDCCILPYENLKFLPVVYDVFAQKSLLQQTINNCSIIPSIA